MTVIRQISRESKAVAKLNISTYIGPRDIRKPLTTVQRRKAFDVACAKYQEERSSSSCWHDNVQPGLSGYQAWQLQVAGRAFGPSCPWIPTSHTVTRKGVHLCSQHGLPVFAGTASQTRYLALGRFECELLHVCRSGSVRGPEDRASRGLCSWTVAGAYVGVQIQVCAVDDPGQHITHGATGWS